MKSYAIYWMVSFPMTLSYLTKVAVFLMSNMSKMLQDRAMVIIENN